jgi:hypothetical protein
MLVGMHDQIYNLMGYAGPHAGGQIQGLMMPPGVQHYQPSANASAQPLGYKSGRAYLPAYSTSPERQSLLIVGF